MLSLLRPHHSTIDGVKYIVVEGNLDRRTAAALARSDDVAIHVLEAPGGTLDFLGPYAHRITHLIVTDRFCGDVRLVETMQRLQELSLFVDPETPVTGGRSPDLRTLALSWSRHLAELVTKAPQLQSLMIERPPADVWRRLPAFTRLELLDLRGSPRLKTVRAFAGCELVTELRLAAVGPLQVTELDRFGELTRLQLDGCKGVTGEPGPSPPSLRDVYLEDCGQVQLDAVLRSPSLRQLTVVGRTHLDPDVLDDLGRRGVRVTAPPGSARGS